MAKVGVIRGTFQILHAGHVGLIRQAKSLVDDLYIVIDNDERVAALKGRCLVPARERMEILASLKGVNQVLCFDDEDDFYSKLLTIGYGYTQQYYFKGGDYKPIDLPEFEWLLKNDWVTCCLGHSGHSTSDLVKRIHK